MTTRIGLEVHIPLDTRAKMFCRCPADGAPEPNSAICPTCTGQPGSRPQGVNRRALELGALAARVLGCRLHATASFQRKHYVYPDLPNNYQRTSTPMGEEGRFWDVGILEVHVEEDPGAYDPATGLVDLNRSGTPLAEIVTAPELASPEDVVTWLRVLRLALDRAGIVRAGAELKADVNVSTAGGDRVEVKNVVGARNAMRAAAFEIARQTGERAAGRDIRRETRHFDEQRGTTKESREKESIGDYRYMLDPDLLPFQPAAFGSLGVVDIPSRVRALQAELGLDLGEALALLEDLALEALFNELRSTVPQELAVDVALRRLRAELDYRGTTLSAAKTPPGLVLELASALAAGKITRHVFVRLLRDALDGKDVRTELAREVGGAGLDLAGVAREVVAANGKVVADYKAGKGAALNFLLGEVMTRTKGRARPDDARAALLDSMR